MAAECIPYKKPGEDITAKAGAAITGKRFVLPSANRTGGGGGGLSTALDNVYVVQHATAAGAALGVSAQTAASGSLVGVICGGIVPVTAGGTIDAGDEVEVGAAGVAVTLASGKAVGICMTGATNGNDAEIYLY